MNCTMYIPAKPLQRFIEKIWVIHDDSLEYSAKIFPDGVVQLIINLGSPYTLLRADGSTSSFSKGSLSGERLGICAVHQHRACYAIGVRFRPGGAFPFFRMPLNELTEHVVDIEMLWGARDVERCRERLVLAGTPEEQCRIVEEFLLEKAGQDLQVNATVEIALKYVLSTEEPSICDVAQTIGISHKHLLRQFDKYVGLNPKALARIQRFQRSLLLLKRRADIEHTSPSLRLSLTEIAYESCYYDQSHFVHEFESFTGMKPTEYLHHRAAQTPSSRFSDPGYAPIGYYMHNLVAASL